MNLIELAVLIEITGSLISLPFVFRIISAHIKREIFDEINGLKESVIKNPDLLVKEFGPVIHSFLEEAIKTGTKEITQGVPMIKLPIIGKVPLSMVEPLLQRFLPKLPGLGSSDNSQDSGKNPFG